MTDFKFKAPLPVRIRGRGGPGKSPSFHPLPGWGQICFSLLATALMFTAPWVAAGAQDDKPPALEEDSTDPSQDIIIEGLGFSKLILAISAGEKISKTARYGRVQRLLEKNLCWSGVFNLSGGASRFCRLRGKPKRVDMRLTLSKERGKGVLRLFDTGPEKLKLFEEAFALGKAAKEWRIMMMINRLTNRITGQPGLLGSTIGFVLRQPGYAKVIVQTNTHGRAPRLLSQHDDINILPRFAPKGQGMVYTVLGRSGSHVFYKNLMPKAKNVPQSQFLTPPGSLNSGGAFSPDGRQVVVTMSVNQNADLFLFDLMSKRHYQLTTRRGIETQAHWSPDGKKLIFVSDRSGTPQIYLMDMQKREDVRMTFETKIQRRPKMEPGRQIDPVHPALQGNRPDPHYGSIRRERAHGIQGPLFFRAGGMVPGRAPNRIRFQSNGGIQVVHRIRRWVQPAPSHHHSKGVRGKQPHLDIPQTISIM